MCDPVTLSVGLGVASGYGAFAATAGTASAIGFGTAVSIGATVGSGTLSLLSQQQASKIEKAKYEAQKQRYKQEARDNYLQDIKDTNSVKTNYMKQYQKSLASIAKSGGTLDSPSYRSILESSKDALRRDLDNLSLSGLEKRMKNTALIQEAELAKQAVNPLGGMAETVVTAGLRTRELFGETQNLSGTKNGDK